jgi:predicted membrane-bound dolichyl-phosphate-mannose-protein mannosyltransferase/membrane-associated phospholipid phosphatase
MSTARLTALSVASTVLVWMVWRGGLPLDRVVVLAWLVLLAVIAFGGNGRATANRAVLDWVPFVVLMVAYDLSRGAADGLGMPLQTRLPIRADELLFGGTVPTVWLQQHLGPFGREVHWWELGVSLVYLSHFVVPFAVGVWWWARDRRRWTWWRNRFLTLTVFGLVTYVVLPGVPPWLAAQRGELPPLQRTSGRGWSLVGLDIADRVLDLGRAAVNTTAALPSLHAAYAAFVAVACWRAARRPVRVLLVAYPVAMGFALVVSGEHYVIDVLLGWAYVATTIVLWRRVDVWLAARRAARPEAAAAPTVSAVPIDPPPADAPDRSLPLAVRVVAVCAAGFALATRALWLGRPDIMVFDEAFYATQALEIAQRGVERGHTVHPPVAKWMIAAGIRVAGFSPIGWRLVPLLAGVAVVACTVVAAFRITRSRSLAGVAGAMVAVDGVAFTTGRLALLDGIVALFATVAFVGLATIAASPLDVVLVRRWRWPIAVAMGLAVASKWSAAPLLVVAVGFVVWSARRAQVPWRRDVLVLTLVPAAIYVASFVPTVVRYDQSAVARVACSDHVTCGTGPIEAVRGIVHDHTRILRFHTELDPTNRYAVSSWNWVLQTRPTEVFDDGDRRMVIRGNLVLWLLGFAAVVWCAWMGLTRRTAVHTLLAWTTLAWWAPWAVGGRPGYSFYASPLVPVLAIATVTAIGSMPARVRRASLVALGSVTLVGVVVMAPQWYAW